MAEKPAKIYTQMAAILADVTAIGKDKKNEAQGFKYRGIDDVYNSLNPILAKHGVFMTAEIVEKAREERTNSKGTVLAFTCLRMRYRFFADDGSSVTTEAEGEGMDSGDKSSNKAMAVAHKYALLQAFCIPTQDLDDPDKDVHEVTSKPTAQKTAPPQGKPTIENDPAKAEARAHWVRINKALRAAKNKADIDAIFEREGKALGTIKEANADAYSGLIKTANDLDEQFAQGEAA